MSSNNTSPIGIFDSGVGGLSVLQHIRKLLPNELLIYVADSGYAPYGCRDDSYIEERSRVITEYLLQLGVKIIVIACNTATASIIEKFRSRYGIPFVGVEPGVKPAAGLTKNHKVGVLATSGTLKSERYEILQQRFSEQADFYNVACPGLADQVETGMLESQQINDLLNSYLDSVLEQNVDTLVLGCTHYSFLNDQIRAYIGDELSLVDTSQAVAEQVKRILTQHGLLNSHRMGHTSYYTTGSISETKQAISRLLKHAVVVNKL